MQIRETFTVDAPPATVWTFFEDIERVARCVPGVQSVDALGPDRYRMVAAQKVGFISATFEMATSIESREPLRSLALASVGRSIKGAIGHLRSKDRVDFEPAPAGGTRVTLTSELAVGGMLGALGHTVIASKSKEITEKFARALQAELRRGDGERAP
jgi:carbon monoxide dehydrogenase subunit G